MNDKIFIDEQLVYNSQKFIDWKSSVESNGVIINNINLLSVITRDRKNLYSAFLDCNLTFPEGQTASRCILIKGGGVVIIPVLKCIDDNETYTLLVKQRRIVDGDYSYEFPAGMIDDECQSPFKAAIKEAKEELGFDISSDELTLLNSKPVKICTAILDEKVFFYSLNKKVSREFLNEIENKSTGIKCEEEHINVKVKKMSELYEIYNSNILIGISLLIKNGIFKL